MKYAQPVVIAAAAVILLMWFQGRQDDSAARWEAHVQAAQIQAKNNAARADSPVAVSETYRKQADSIQAVADSMAALRPRLIVRIDSVPVPAEAVPYTAPRDTLIAILTDENTALRSVAERLTVSNTNLLTANALLKETVGELNSVLDKRPKPRSRLIPQLGAGLMAGICADYKPCTGLGLTLSWRL